MDLDTVTDELYGLDPSEFVAARTRAVTAAREAGDRELAGKLGALRKPTTTGWALNMLVRADPDGIRELLDLGNRLRTAQQALRSGELRQLAAGRSALVSTLTDRAAATAGEHGRDLTDNVLREVGQSLSAAVADPDVAADLRRGRMINAATYSGFGPAVLAAVPTPAADGDEPTSEGTASPDGPDATHREARDAARRAALETVAVAEEAVRRTNSELEAAIAKAEDATRHVRDLRDELSRAEQENRFAERARRSADDAVRHATAELERARRHADGL